jgi:LysR family transcriptional regulator, regulator for bpeEF and oprC
MAIPMLDRLASVRIFVRTVELGSFSAAARDLGLTQPTVSKQIAGLEARLGARLIRRSTRSLALTLEGERYYRHVRSALEAFEEAAAEVGHASAPTGPVRIACGASLGRFKVTPLINGFLTLHPGVSIELDLSDRVVNLIEHGADLAIRVGELEDSSLVARRIGRAGRACVATPDYLQRMGIPREPLDLLGHNCLVYTARPSPSDWQFAGPSGDISVRVSGRFRANTPGAIRDLVLAGQGIGLLTSWLYAEDVAAGRLTRLLKGYEPPALPIHVLTVGGRFLPERVRVFIAYLADAFRVDPALSDQPYRPAPGSAAPP